MHRRCQCVPAVTLTLTEQMAHTAWWLVWTSVIQTCHIFYISSHIYLALQWSATSSAFIGLQPELRAVRGDRDGGCTTANLGLIVLLCRSHPPHLISVKVRLPDMVNKLVTCCVCVCVCGCMCVSYQRNYNTDRTDWILVSGYICWMLLKLE